VFGLSAALTGCAGELGPTQMEVIDLPRPADLAQVWDVDLSLGAASVVVDSSAEGLIQGSIEYNVEGLKPSVIISPRRVEIYQEFSGVLPVGTRNDWRLRLGRGVPLNLTVNTGASSGEWELGGLSLRRLGWTQGAADAKLRFSQPNPESMQNLRINGGAATLTVRGLANANALVANITAGGGLMTLHLDGQLARDSEIILDGGVSSIAIYSGGNPIQLTAEGALKTIDNSGWTTIDDDTYRSPEWVDDGRPKMTIRARLGVAALRLIAGN
jgi:hypothetical protein